MVRDIGRREFLVGTGTAGTVGVAGCIGGGGNDGDWRGRHADAERPAEDGATGADEEQGADVGPAQPRDGVGRRPPGKGAARDVIAVREVREVEDAVGHRQPDAGQPDDETAHHAVPDERSEPRERDRTGDQQPPDERREKDQPNGGKKERQRPVDSERHPPPPCVRNSGLSSRCHVFSCCVRT
jgi:hypothetical protein